MKKTTKAQPAEMNLIRSNAEWEKSTQLLLWPLNILHDTAATSPPPPSLLSVAEIWASAGVGGSSLARYDLENWLHIVVGLTTPFLRSCPVCQSWGLREHGDVHFTSFISVLATDVEMFMTHLCNTEPGISKRSCLLSINFTILQVRKNMVLLTTKQNISSIMSCFFHSMCFHTIDERKH